MTVDSRHHPNARAATVVHRTTCGTERDVVVRRPDGIAVTSPPRSAADSAAFLAPADVESRVEHGIANGRFIVPTLWEVANRLQCPGRKGSSARPPG